jgi:hypothetical protein
MAKITRNKKSNIVKEDGKEINLDTGDISAPSVQVWTLSLQNNFVKCASLVEQIKERELNLVDETNITSISYSLVPFGDKGKNLFHQICLYQTVFSTEKLEDIWHQALEKSSLKTPYKFIKICREKGLEIKLTEDDDVWEYKIRDPGQSPRPFTDEMTEKDREEVNEFGFIEKENCYYFADYNTENKICTLTRRSNFVLKILFHINRGKQNKRVIELANYRNRKITLDIETKQLTSYNLFKELTEGQGNFLFDGGPLELTKIKNKLFELEKPSKQIDTLGWSNEGKFFAFSNGLYKDKFYPVDEHGIVTLNEKNYFIPYHPGTDEGSHLNEKRFSYKHSTITFEKWSSLYCQAFGKVGELALVFLVSTLFSDHIFFVRENFPMLFLYGEGGSGKSRVGLYGQYLYGTPQPPLKLTEKANTDKSKIRKLAQYVNAMILLEEFSNDIDISAIKTITGIYDRFGYERSNMDSKYGTETVPINSTAMVTGNWYPQDDPLMQRFILADYNANRRDENVTKAYDELTALNREGLTEITGQLLQLRPKFVERWERYFRPQCDAFKKKISEKGITVPDRMIENYSVMLTTAKVCLDIGLKLPIKFDEFTKFLVDTITAQAQKRDTGSVTQQWWDIVLQLANEGKIKHGREYVITGDKLSIRFTELYGFYQEKYARQNYKAAPNKSSLLQKLQSSGTMVSTETRAMRLGTSNPTTVYDFYYDKLGIDLMHATLYQEEQKKRFYQANGDRQPTEPTEKGSQPKIFPDGSRNYDNPEKAQNQSENDDMPF